MSPLLFLKKRCLYDTQEHALWFHIHLVSRPNRWAFQVFFGLKIKDVTNFRFRITFKNEERTTLKSKNEIQKTGSLENMKGTGSMRPKGFIPKVKPGKPNLNPWKKDAVWVGEDGR